MQYYRDGKRSRGNFVCRVCPNVHTGCANECGLIHPSARMEVFSHDVLGSYVRLCYNDLDGKCQFSNCRYLHYSDKYRNSTYSLKKNGPILVDLSLILGNKSENNASASKCTLNNEQSSEKLVVLLCPQGDRCSSKHCCHYAHPLPHIKIEYAKEYGSYVSACYDFFSNNHCVSGDPTKCLYYHPFTSNSVGIMTISHGRTLFKVIENNVPKVIPKPPEASPNLSTTERRIPLIQNSPCEIMNDWSNNKQRPIFADIFVEDDNVICLDCERREAEFECSNCSTDAEKPLRICGECSSKIHGGKYMGNHSVKSFSIKKERVKFHAKSYSDLKNSLNEKLEKLPRIKLYNEVISKRKEYSKKVFMKAMQTAYARLAKEFDSEYNEKIATVDGIVKEIENEISLQRQLEEQCDHILSAPDRKFMDEYEKLMSSIESSLKFDLSASLKCLPESMDYFTYLICSGTELNSFDGINLRLDEKPVTLPLDESVHLKDITKSIQNFSLKTLISSSGTLYIAPTTLTTGMENYLFALNTRIQREFLIKNWKSLDELIKEGKVKNLDILEPFQSCFYRDGNTEWHRSHIISIQSNNKGLFLQDIDLGTNVTASLTQIVPCFPDLNENAKILYDEAPSFAYEVVLDDDFPRENILRDIKLHYEDFCIDYLGANKYSLKVIFMKPITFEERVVWYVEAFKPEVSDIKLQQQYFNKLTSSDSDDNYDHVPLISLKDAFVESLRKEKESNQSSMPSTDIRLATGDAYQVGLSTNSDDVADSDSGIPDTTNEITSSSSPSIMNGNPSPAVVTTSTISIESLKVAGSENSGEEVNALSEM